MSLPALQLTKVKKYFGEGRTAVRAVDQVSLNVKKGEVLLIMGPSGSGKTTLLTLIGGLLSPDSGTVQIDCYDLDKIPERDRNVFRRKNIGFVFQSFHLLSALTAQENVQIVLGLAKVKRAEARRRTLKMLRELGLGRRLHYLPKKLSGGEKQRVSIARALINEPRLVLADEPTANLDSAAGHQIMALLRDIAKKQGRTVIIVSHDMRIMDIADRVLWMEDGQFVRTGIQVAVDPVCGMKIRKDQAFFKGIYNGRTYYFCSERDKEKFEASPEAFLRT